MKHLPILILSLFSFFSINNILISQTSIPYRNFEIKHSEFLETYTDGQNCKYRSSDKAILKSYNMNVESNAINMKEKAMNYIKTIWKKLKHRENPESVLKYEESNQSERTIVFNQYYKGIPVDQNQVIIRFDKNKQHIISLDQNTVPLKQVIDINPKFPITKINSIFCKHFGIKDLKVIGFPLKLIHIVNDKPYLSYMEKFKTHNPTGNWVGFIDANTGKILELRSNSMHINGTGRIFNPDPISSSHQKYGTNGLEDNGINSSFEQYYQLVPLNDIKLAGSNYILSGPSARIYDSNLYTSSSEHFEYFRNEDGFEAVMCYYYMNKTIEYAKDNVYFNNFVYFNPHVDGSNSEYDGNGLIKIANGDNSVDHGEDAMMILHESFHFIHHNLAGYSGLSYQLKIDGVGEGLCDYWALSEVNKDKNYKDYEVEYYRIFRWANFNPGTVPVPPGNPNYQFANTNRIALPGFNGIYYNHPFNCGDCNDYYQGTVLSAVLMQIYNSIGKEKTDLMVLTALANIKYLFDSQADIATKMFSVTGPGELNFEERERCIIWNLFNKTYNGTSNTSAEKFLPQQFSGSGSDLYIRDDVDDHGNESNTTSSDIWESEDIWIRPTKDDKPYHNNAVFRKGNVDKRNYVYVKIRSRGCIPVSDAILHVYWSKASTGLQWPTNWNTSYDPNNGKQISGEIGQINLNMLGIEAGEAAIVNLEWIPPNPEDFNDNDKNHYCLYGRIVTNQDPMHCVEVGDPNLNARCNNNIAWKNFTILAVPGYQKDTSILYIRDIFTSGTSSSCLQLRDANLPHYGSLINNASLDFRLREPLKTIWLNGGMQGSGFSYNTESGLFTVTALPVILCNLNLVSMQNYLMDFYFTGNGDPKPFALDLRHYKQNIAGGIIGGERFIYPGIGTEALPRTNNSQTIEYSNFNIMCSPNPVGKNIYLRLNKLLTKFELTVFDINGKILLSRSVLNNSSMDFNLNLEDIKEFGLMFIRVEDDIFSKTIKVIKI